MVIFNCSIIPGGGRVNSHVVNKGTNRGMSMYKILLITLFTFMLVGCSGGGKYIEPYSENEIEYEIDEEVYTLDEAKEVLYDELYDEIYDEVYEEIYDEGYEDGTDDHIEEISLQIEDILSGRITFEDFVYDNH